MALVPLYGINLPEYRRTGTTFYRSDDTFCFSFACGRLDNDRLGQRKASISESRISLADASSHSTVASAPGTVKSGLKTIPMILESPTVSSCRGTTRSTEEVSKEPSAPEANYLNKIHQFTANNFYLSKYCCLVANTKSSVIILPALSPSLIPYYSHFLSEGRLHDP